MKTIANNLLFSFLLLTHLLAGQSVRVPLSGGYTGLGAYSIRHTDIFSFTSNQAALAQLQHAVVAVYAEQRFMLKELNNITAAVGIKTNSGNIGMKANYYGNPDYNEMQLGLAYGRKLGAKVDIGAQFNLNNIAISSGYGSASAISVDIGTVWHISERLHTGLHAANPVGSKYGKAQHEKLASVYTIGFGFDASEKLMCSAEIQKEENQPVNVKAGVQYKFVKQLLVRIGVSSATSSVWFGAGLFLKTLRVDITASYHPQLGITPGLLLLYQLKKIKK